MTVTVTVTVTTFAPGGAHAGHCGCTDCRQQRLRADNALIMEWRKAGISPRPSRAAPAPLQPRPRAVHAHAELATATTARAAPAPLAGVVHPERTRTAVTVAGLAAATATAGAPDAGEWRRAKGRAKSRRYYARHREAQGRAHRAWRQASPEAVSEQNRRAYDRDEHTKRQRDYRARRRASAGIGANPAAVTGTAAALAPVPAIGAVTQ